MTTPGTVAPLSARTGPGVFATAIVGVVLSALALSLDFPRAAHGFKGDEATYYTLAHSLARDGDFAFTRDDLIRVWHEFPAGPEGIFLKRGRALDLQRAGAFPWMRVASHPDPNGERLYFGKSYIYPLVAAPLLVAFGTNGFLVLHALLLTLCFGAAVAWLRSRGSTPGGAVAFALAFFAASVVPVYFVWLAPEIFNFALVLLAYFAWSYKEGTAPALTGRLHAFLHRPSSDHLAVVLLAVATFSKPIHVGLIGPLVVLALWRRQWTRGAVMLALFAAIVTGLFLVNLAATGELNYQGGDRKTFYGQTGFPFANEHETFETTGLGRATDRVPVDILVTDHTFTVFRHNVAYFLIGRYSGLLPYFFPGLLAFAWFLADRRGQLWQWLTAGVAVGAAAVLILYMPYTYSGGGGPVGNRYYLSFYPLFLFLTPAVVTPAAPLVAVGVGALFTAKLLANPFYTSFNPGEHAKAGPLRALPIEVTQLNDLPVAAKPERARLAMAGAPTIYAYFPDDNAYDREEDWFWVRGRARADIVLRAPALDADTARPRPLQLLALDIEVENGWRENTVTIRTGAQTERLTLAPGERARTRLRAGRGVPYRPNIYPTNFLYEISIATRDGFVPFLEVPGSTDSRFLGARVRLTPVYRPSQE
jgi:hypothetical protein